MKSILLATLLLSSTAFGWGGRGHDTICRTASFLVKEKGLKDYLRNKPQMMGHLCNMPDFYWKSLGGDAVKYGSPAHFMDPEVTGMAVKDIPVDYKQIVKDFTGKENKFKKDGSTLKFIPNELGSAWWRADQFVRRIEALKPQFDAAKVPANRKEEQDNELAYNKLAYQMVTDMGLMGHFTGDTSQPFHTTADYDGWATGHGGIHAYFEDAIVGEFDGDLDALVLKEARAMKNPSFLKPPTVIEKMKALSLLSMSDAPKILKMDPVIKKSSVVKDHGMEVRTDAERKDPAVAFKLMKNIALQNLARGAVMTAALWDEAYVKAGRPKIGAYKSYKYPFTVDFVMPDYFDIPEDKATDKK
ncbi:hypothetical protein [Bdellovibrio sp. NC01]|uniref:hypothetical protein n=1 Tax=Bdellovibrio sp. NC01 TaxID=2220073 RepID=UPI001157004A|nr:hypothetical protein [Bdellovibrio sp. NC01]QDK36510.1 hypothetical protein DOE51_02305 [Bdellovibrio sp. NC01]